MSLDKADDFSKFEFCKYESKRYANKIFQESQIRISWTKSNNVSNLNYTVYVPTCIRMVQKSRMFHDVNEQSY